MTDNVLPFASRGAGHDPNVVLEQAKGAYGHVVVLGCPPEDDFDLRASLNLTRSEILWLLRLAERRLFEADAT